MKNYNVIISKNGKEWSAFVAPVTIDECKKFVSGRSFNKDISCRYTIKAF